MGDGSASLLSQVSHILPLSLKRATQFERMPGMCLISIATGIVLYLNKACCPPIGETKNFARANLRLMR